MSEEVEKNLTPKERLFIAAYLGDAHFNATEAARQAGYKGNGNTLGVIAWRMLRKAKIQEQINESLAALTMPANVVLKRLTDIAEGSIENLLDDTGKFDYQGAKKAGKLPLVKKLKRKTTSRQVDRIADDEDEVLESSIIYEEVEFEMYSAHEALRDLGKYHKLFTDKHEISGEDGRPIEQKIIVEFTDGGIK